ncbi:MAG TPA: 30S ribosomal protein S20 [Candidatus Merdivicinus intestinavium]|nr:30S ribosomal protein S20 [Candidatus Merdivicinus intestinavium]
MPNIQSAKKRVKVSATKTMQNRLLKGNLKAALKAVNSAIAENADNKAEIAKAAYKTIDQSAAKGIIHKNAAARKKSQIASKLNAAKA